MGSIVIYSTNTSTRIPKLAVYWNDEKRCTLTNKRKRCVPLNTIVNVYSDVTQIHTLDISS